MNSSETNKIYKVVGLWLILVLSLSLSASSIKIMPLGDSITEGVSNVPEHKDRNISLYVKNNDGVKIANSVNDRVAYRGKLYDLLKERGYSFGSSDGELDFVGGRNSGSNYGSFDMDHEGHGGWTSEQIADNIENFLTANSADIVLLQIGTNDPGKEIPIGSYDDINQTSNTSVNNIRKILDTIFAKNPNTKVLLAKIIEARRAHGWINGWTTQAFNDAVVEMANDHNFSENIKIVDNQSGAGLIYNPCGLPNDMLPFHDDNGTYSYDFHPNENGYAKLAKNWFDALVASDWLPSVDIDKTPPVITLVGTQEINLTVGESYTELGATALDNVDGDISNKITIYKNNVDTNVVGRYEVLYSVSDSAGNQATKKRIVNVKAVVHSGEWYSYDKVVKTATITPLGGSEQSMLTVESGLDVSFLVEGNSVALRYKFGFNKQAYIIANVNGEIKTGFKNQMSNETTLKDDTLYKAGTHTVIKRDNSEKIEIESRVKLTRGESLIIGGN
jgi:lysophospholipase L1-like esterase